MFGVRKPKPLLYCETVHALPGRVRIFCRALRYLADQRAAIETRIDEVSGIVSARVSSPTANVLVHFNENLLTAESVREAVEAVISACSLEAYKSERQEQTSLTVTERRLQNEPVGEMATRVAVTTAALVFHGLRRAGHAHRPRCSSA